MKQQHIGAVAAAAVASVVLVITGLFALPAFSAVPGTPAQCAAEKVTGGYEVTYSQVTANPAVNWYPIKVKGTSATPVKGELDGSTLFTGSTTGGSTPLTFLVASHNPDGRSGWCEAEVGADPDPDPTDPPTTDPTDPPTTDPTDPPTTEPPGTEIDLDEVGIRVFPQYSGATYGNHEQVLDDLGRLGIKRISGLLTPNMSADEISFYQQANARHGIKVWFAIGKPGTVLSDSQWTQVRNLLSGPLNGIVEVASGWNEPNHQVGGDWSTTTAAHQRKLWTNVQAVNSATGQSILTGTPPLWSGNVNEQYADLRVLAPKIQGAYDLINWHLYPHGNTGAALEAFIDRQVAEFRAAYGAGHPLLNSESGYSTSVGSSNGNPVTYEQQAALIDDLILFHQERGIWISYFEFLDDPDPSSTNREANFGLIETPSTNPDSWFDKPAYDVVAEMLANAA